MSDYKLEEKAFAERLKYLMEIRGISQKELAEKTGLSIRTIQRYLYGETKPNKCIIEGLANALRSSSEFLSADCKHDSEDDLNAAKVLVNRNKNKWNNDEKQELVRSILRGS